MFKEMKVKLKNSGRKQETSGKLDILDLKISIIKIKNSINRLNSILDTAEKGISELKDRSQEIIQNETQRHKDEKYKKGSKRHRKCIKKLLHTLH